MGHHIGNKNTSFEWSRVCNDLIHRVCLLYPDNFVGVRQLPQSPGVPPKNCIAELERVWMNWASSVVILTPVPRVAIGAIRP